MAYVIKVKFEDSLRRLTVQSTNGEGLLYSGLESRIRDLFQIPSTAGFVVTYTDSDGDIVTMANDHDLTDALVQQGLNPLRLQVTMRNSESATEVQPQVGDAEVVDPVEVESLNVQLSTALKKLAHPDVDYMKQLVQSSERLFENVKTPAQMKTLVDSFVRGIISHTSSIATPSANPVASASSPPTPPKVLSAPRQILQAPPSPANSAPPAGNFGGSRDNVDLPVHHGVICDVCNMAPIVGLRWKAIKKYNYDLCNTCFEENGDANEYTKLDKPMFRPRHMLNNKMMRSCSVHSHDRGMRLHGPHPMGAENLDRLPWSGSLHGRGRQSVGNMRGPGARHLGSMRNWVGKLDARFVRDVTVFDGTEVAPGRRFTKIWRLRNSGDVAWPANTKLVHIGGDELGQVEEVLLEIPADGLAPEAEIDASVDLVAPQKPGRYVSHWRLASPYGPKFGHRVWVLIQVLPHEAFERSDLEYQASTVGLEERTEAPVHVKGENVESFSNLNFEKVKSLTAMYNNMIEPSQAAVSKREKLESASNVQNAQLNLQPESNSRQVQASSGLPINQNIEDKSRAAPLYPEVFSKDLDFTTGFDVKAENLESQRESVKTFGDFAKYPSNDLSQQSELVAKVDSGNSSFVDGSSEVNVLSAMLPVIDGFEATDESEETREKTVRGPSMDDAPEAYFYNASEIDPFSFLTDTSMNVVENDATPAIKYPNLEDLLHKSGEINFVKDEEKEDKISYPKDIFADLMPLRNVSVEASVEDVSLAATAEDLSLAASVEDPSVVASTEDFTGLASVEEPVTVEASVEDLSVEASVENSTVEASVENFTAEVSEEAVGREEEISSPEALEAKLQAMGFTDSKLNLEILTKNDFDIRKTLDDLCTAEEWDPILEELEEMGFYDTDMNRRLMFKNNGSVKRVVKDLVKMDKTVMTGGKGKEIAQ